jgi:hypothetical protein
MQYNKIIKGGETHMGIAEVNVNGFVFKYNHTNGEALLNVHDALEFVAKIPPGEVMATDNWKSASIMQKKLFHNYRVRRFLTAEELDNVTKWKQERDGQSGMVDEDGELIPGISDDYNYLCDTKWVKVHYMFVDAEYVFNNITLHEEYSVTQIEYDAVPYDMKDEFEDAMQYSKVIEIQSRAYSGSKTYWPEDKGDIEGKSIVLPYPVADIQKLILNAMIAFVTKHPWNDGKVDTEYLDKLVNENFMHIDESIDSIDKETFKIIILNLCGQIHRAQLTAFADMIEAIGKEE